MKDCPPLRDPFGRMGSDKPSKSLDLGSRQAGQKIMWKSRGLFRQIFEKKKFRSLTNLGKMEEIWKRASKSVLHLEIHSAWDPLGLGYHFIFQGRWNAVFLNPWDNFINFRVHQSTHGRRVFAFEDRTTHSFPFHPLSVSQFLDDYPSKDQSRLKSS